MKISFTYDNKESNSKKALLLNELEKKRQSKISDTNSLKNTLTLTNKTDATKLEQFNASFAKINNVSNIELQLQPDSSNNLTNVSYNSNVIDDILSNTLINNKIDNKREQFANLNIYNNNQPILKENANEFDYIKDTPSIQFIIHNNTDYTNLNQFQKFSENVIRESTDLFESDRMNINNVFNMTSKIYAHNNQFGLIFNDNVDTNHFQIQNNGGVEIANLYEIINKNINILKRRGINTIHNVYQSTYNNDIKSTGLGDFIRGCYFLIEFCKKYGFNYKVIFNNDIANGLESNNNNLTISNIKKNIFNKPVLAEIKIYNKNNFMNYNISHDNFVMEPIKDVNIIESFTEYLVNTSLQLRNHLLIYCIAYPVCDEISEETKQTMREILEPNGEIKLTVNQVLQGLSLKHRKYITIHIRSGDNYLNDVGNSHFKKQYIRTLINEIKNVIYQNNKSSEYLLLTDNNSVKSLVLKVLSQENINIKSLFKEIIHTSLINASNSNINDKTKNTLTEFYLLSFSQKIYSFSSYQHGSGFSYWCAKTFNIPYSCKYMPSD